MGRDMRCHSGMGSGLPSASRMDFFRNRRGNENFSSESFCDGGPVVPDSACSASSRRRGCRLATRMRSSDRAANTTKAPARATPTIPPIDRVEEPAASSRASIEARG